MSFNRSSDLDTMPQPHRPSIRGIGLLLALLVAGLIWQGPAWAEITTAPPRQTVPTPTPRRTATRVPPTATTQPINTPTSVPPTATSQPPTATPPSPVVTTAPTNTPKPSPSATVAPTHTPKPGNGDKPAIASPTPTTHPAEPTMTLTPAVLTLTPTSTGVQLNTPTPTPTTRTTTSPASPAASHTPTRSPTAPSKPPMTTPAASNTPTRVPIAAHPNSTEVAILANLESRLEARDGRTSFIFPAGTTPGEPLIIRYTPQSPQGVMLPEGWDAGSLAFSLEAFYQDWTPVETPLLNKAATLTIRLTAEDLSFLQDANAIMALLYYDSAAKAWVSIESEIDRTASTLVVPIRRLGFYTLARRSPVTITTGPTLPLIPLIGLAVLIVIVVGVILFRRRHRTP